MEKRKTYKERKNERSKRRLEKEYLMCRILYRLLVNKEFDYEASKRSITPGVVTDLSNFARELHDGIKELESEDDED